MTKSVPLVNVLVKRDLEKRGKSYDDVAAMLCKCSKQVGRQIRGETKLGIIAVDFLADLKNEGLIDEETADQWWPSVRQTLRFKFKKENPSWLERGLRKIFIR